MRDPAAVISDFLGADPIAGWAATEELLRLGDAGEAALFASPRPFPELRQLRRRWLSYVASREETVSRRLLSSLRKNSPDASLAAFLIAGLTDARAVKNELWDLLKQSSEPDVIMAWGYAGGSASALWDKVSSNNYLWDKRCAFAFRAGCVSFARVNTEDAWALGQLVTHAWEDLRLEVIKAGPDDSIPVSAVDAGELHMAAFNVFTSWRRGEVADEVLRRWSGPDVHWRLRAFGAEVLEGLGFSRVVSPALEWLRRETVDEVRRSLLGVLARSGTEEGANVLLEELEEGRWTFPAVMGAWRASDRDRASRALLNVPEDRLLLANALVPLARLGHPHRLLPTLLDSGDPYVRLNAALAFAYLGNAAVCGRLRQMRGEAATPLEHAMLTVSLSMLGDRDGPRLIHEALIAAGVDPDFRRRIDFSQLHEHLQAAILAGLAAQEALDRALHDAWQAELAPLKPRPTPHQAKVAPEAISPARGSIGNSDAVSHRSDTSMRILFLAANPLTTSPLDLEEELRGLEQALMGVRFRDAISLTAKHAVRPDDLVACMRQHRPNVIHFSGHGSTQGICLRSDDSQTYHSITGASLQRFLKGRGVDLVVLNACYSGTQAVAIREAVEAVIGTTDAVNDEAARRFTVAFYRALGNGLPIAEAFRDGSDAVALYGFEDVFHKDGALDRVLVS